MQKLLIKGRSVLYAGFNAAHVVMDGKELEQVDRLAQDEFAQVPEFNGNTGRPQCWECIDQHVFFDCAADKDYTVEIH